MAVTLARKKRTLDPPVHGVILLSLLSLPFMRQSLEASLIGHMLVQIPLLATGGWLLGSGFSGGKWNAHGVPGLLLALFAMLFWMIPRWLDASLNEPMVEVAKFVTIPLLIGLPLSMSWKRLPLVLRGLVWADGISMLAVLGWLYVAAPVRVCNNYLINQQEIFGYTAMGLALFIALYWTLAGFFGDWRSLEDQ